MLEISLRKDHYKAAIVESLQPHARIPVQYEVAVEFDADFKVVNTCQDIASSKPGLSGLEVQVRKFLRNCLKPVPCLVSFSQLIDHFNSHVNEVDDTVIHVVTKTKVSCKDCVVRGLLELLSAVVMLRNAPKVRGQVVDVINLKVLSAAVEEGGG